MKTSKKFRNIVSTSISIEKQNISITILPINSFWVNILGIFFYFFVCFFFKDLGWKWFPNLFSNSKIILMHPFFNEDITKFSSYRLTNVFVNNLAMSQHSYCFILTGNSSQIFHLLRYCEKITTRAIVLKSKQQVFMKKKFCALIHVLCKTLSHSLLTDYLLVSIYNWYGSLLVFIFVQKNHYIFAMLHIFCSYTYVT